MDRFEPEHWPRFVRFPAFTRDWERLGLNDDDLRALELEIIRNPSRPPVIRGTGGLRKIRYAEPGAGRGKRGAFRVCFADFPEFGTVALVVVFGKNEKDNLTPADRDAIALVIRLFRDELQREAAPARPRRRRRKHDGQGEPGEGETKAKGETGD